MLNFSDPSKFSVIDDNSSHLICNTQIACGMQYLVSAPTTGIVLTLFLNDQTVVLTPYRWNAWELNSDSVLDPNMVVEVEKESLGIIRQGLRNMTFTPKR